MCNFSFSVLSVCSYKNVHVAKEAHETRAEQYAFSDSEIVYCYKCTIILSQQDSEFCT